MDQARNPVFNSHGWLEPLAQSKGCYSRTFPVILRHSNPRVLWWMFLCCHFLLQEKLATTAEWENESNRAKWRTSKAEGNKSTGHWCRLSLISCQIFMYNLSMKIPVNFPTLIFSLCHKESIFFHWGQWVYQNSAQFLSKGRIVNAECRMLWFPGENRRIGLRILEVIAYGRFLLNQFQSFPVSVRFLIPKKLVFTNVRDIFSESSEV